MIPLRMKIELIRWLWLLLIFGPACGLPATAETRKYTYVDSSGLAQGPATLTVEETPALTRITFVNEFKDTTICLVKDKDKLVATSYIDPAGQEIGSVVYDQAQHWVTVTGTVQAKYKYDFPIFENNGILFYFFSVWYPAPGKQLAFKMVQGDYSRIQDSWQRWMLAQLVGPIPMALKSVGRETVKLKSGASEAEKYELGVNDSIMSLFWPHKYYFWYAVPDRRLLQYSGHNRDNRVNTYVLSE